MVVLNAARVVFPGKGDTMSRLRDYSGQLNLNIKLEDVSKDVLVELFKMYGRLYLAVDGF